MVALLVIAAALVVYGRRSELAEQVLDALRPGG